MRKVFALAERMWLRPRQSGDREEKSGHRTDALRRFSGHLQSEAQVEESDLIPDDGQTPKYDERLLDDVGAGDPQQTSICHRTPLEGNKLCPSV